MDAVDQSVSAEYLRLPEQEGQGLEEGLEVVVVIYGSLFVQLDVPKHLRTENTNQAVGESCSSYVFIHHRTEQYDTPRINLLKGNALNLVHCSHQSTLDITLIYSSVKATENASFSGVSFCSPASQ